MREFTSDAPYLFADGGLATGLEGCSAVVHLASRVNPKLAEEHPSAVTADRAGFRALLDGLSRTDRAIGLVLPSSGGTVYDPAVPPPYAERAPCRPSGAYGHLRLELEEMALRPDSAIRPVVLRISNVYGPGQRTGTGQGVVAHWLAAALHGEPIELFGDPDARRDYVYVDDVVEAILAATDALADGRELPPTVNVGAGRPTSLRDLLAELAGVVGEERIEVKEMVARSFDRRDTWLDVSLAERTLGWRPTTSLASGLRSTWEFMVRDSAPESRTGPGSCEPAVN